MVPALYTVNEPFLDVLALLPPTPLIGLLQEGLISWLEVVEVAKEDHFLMEVFLKKDGVFLTVDETLEHFGEVANVIKHFLEAWLRPEKHI